MTVEANIFNALKGLVGNRVYPDVAPPNTSRPYITYQQVGGEPVNFIDPTVPDKRNGRFQFNVWADTRSEASSIGRQVEDTLRTVAALQTSVLGGPVSSYEQDTQLYGTLQDFSFWF